MSGFYKKFLIVALPALALVSTMPAYEANITPFALLSIILGVLVAYEILKAKWNKKHVFVVEIIISAILIVMLFALKIPRLILAYLLCVAYAHGGLMVRLKCMDRINRAFVVILLVTSAVFSPLFYFVFVEVLSL